MTHIADNHEALLDYLYEEGDPAERLQIARHLQECAACSVAVLEFQSVRGMLSEWAPPASELGFRVVQDPSPGAAVEPHARRNWWPAWNPVTSKGMLQAAAAAVLFVSGMAFSQLDVRYDNGTVSVRPRFLAPSDQNMRTASIPLAPDSSNVPVVANPEVAAPSAVMPVDREELLQRVRSMIDQSEERQQRELALRLSQVTREVDTQHQADLLRIQQDFGQQQEATMDYLVRTSGGVK